MNQQTPRHTPGLSEMVNPVRKKNHLTDIVDRAHIRLLSLQEIVKVPTKPRLKLQLPNRLIHTS